MNRSASRSIDQYLQQLREELAGSKTPALIQDALYDAEEYLRAEIAAHPDKSESDVLEIDCLHLRGCRRRWRPPIATPRSR